MTNPELEYDELECDELENEKLNELGENPSPKELEKWLQGIKKEAKRYLKKHNLEKIANTSIADSLDKSNRLIAEMRFRERHCQCCKCKSKIGKSFVKN